MYVQMALFPHFSMIQGFVGFYHPQILSATMIGEKSSDEAPQRPQIYHTLRSRTLSDSMKMDDSLHETT